MLTGNVTTAAQQKAPRARLGFYPRIESNVDLGLPFSLSSMCSFSWLCP